MNNRHGKVNDFRRETRKDHVRTAGYAGVSFSPAMSWEYYIVAMRQRVRPVRRAKRGVSKITRCACLRFALKEVSR